jgi:hypothetical protein
MNDRDDLADLHGDRIAITDARLEGFSVGDPRPETAGDRPWKRFVFTSEAGACGMSDPYDTDAVTWAEQQASLLPRIAAGERANDQIDWEDVGGRERREGHQGVHSGHSPQALSARLAPFGGGAPLGARGADSSRHGAAPIPQQYAPVHHIGELAGGLPERAA